MTEGANKRYLLALDRSEQAAQAARYLALLLPTQGVEIVIFHVNSSHREALLDLGMPDGYYQNLDDDIKDLLKKEDQELQETMDRAAGFFLKAGFPQHRVFTKVEERRVGFARDIMAEAKRDYHAVILGRRGASRFKDLVLGSMAVKLVNRVDFVPVWVVGGSPSPNRVLIAMDPSENSLATVDYVARTLPGGKAKILLYHVIRNFEYGGSFIQNYISPSMEQRINQSVMEAMDPVFDKAQEKLEAAGFSPENIQRKYQANAASRAASICRAADDYNCGTIVVGRRGLTKSEEFFMGRVSTRVVDFAKNQAVWVVS